MRTDRTGTPPIAPDTKAVTTVRSGNCVPPIQPDDPATTTPDVAWTAPWETDIGMLVHVTSTDISHHYPVLN